MSMTDIRITPAAQATFDALSEAKPERAEAVHAAIREIGTRTGEPLDIPGSPPDTPFLALKTSLRDAPVVVYRRTLPDEPGDWLVVSLLSPEEYQDVRRAEEIMSTAPAVREIVNAVVAGTVATVNVTAHPGTVTQPGGAATTSTTDK